MSEPWYTRADNALRYYLGPAYEPVEMLGNALSAFSPGADMIDMQQQSNALMQSHGGWDTVGAIGGLGAATLGMAIPGTAKGISEGVEGAVDGIRAYHGSPHDFDAFSMDKIGTGEGAQAYGHGLYFAEKEGVAEAYREQLTDPHIGGRGHVTSYRVGDKELSRESPDWTAASIADMIKEHNIDLSTPDGIDWLESEIGARNMTSARSVPFEETANRVREFLASGVQREDHVGRMYEVNINASPDDFLDWDKPLSEQSEKVRAGYAAARGDNPDMEGLGYRSGMSMVSDVGLLAGPQEGFGSLYPAATKRLREAGIPGIRYLDQGSRTAGDGSRNYVIFDPSIISILRKYGILGAAGLGAGGYALGSDQGQQY